MIRRIVIKNYRGIEAQDVDVPPSGAIVKGRNGGGKTTLLKAVHAALLAQDVGADAIRIGAEKAEILVDWDDVSVRRVITPKTSTINVTRDGMQAKAPQTFLRELLGTSSLDPMALLTLKGKERRAAVLAALPVTVDADAIRRWWPEAPEVSTEGHGLEVVDRVRKLAYDARTAVNAQVKELAEKVSSGESSVDGLGAPIWTDVTQLRIALQSVLDSLAKDEAKRKMLEESSAKRKAMSDASDAVVLKRGQEVVQLMDAQRRRLSPEVFAALSQHAAKLEAELEKAKADIKDAMEAERAVGESEAKLRNYDIELARLSSVQDAMSVDTLSDEQIAALRAEQDSLSNRITVAEENNKLTETKAKWVARLDNIRASLAEKQAEQTKLDAAVKTLTKDAPSELLAKCDGIEGLGVDGDSVTLDGKSLDALCGAEQVRFCVEVARRANAKSKILVVDGLERLDPEQLDVFIQEATRDGWQLLASRVDSGDVVIEAISTMEGAVQ